MNTEEENGQSVTDFKKEKATKATAKLKNRRRGSHSTAEQHERAFNVYYDTRNWAAVSKALKVAYQTPFKWAKKDYRCNEGCPWHGWADLVQERDVLMQTRLGLIEAGQYDPKVVDKELRASVAKSPDSKKFISTDRKSHLYMLLKSDTERICHYEMLYSKIFFELTGLMLDYQSAAKLGIDGEPLDMDTFLRAGIKCKSMEGGIKALVQVQEQIDILKVRAGLIDDSGKSKAVSELSTITEEEPMTLNDLRNVRNKLQNTSPDQLDAMKAILNADDTAQETIVEEPDANSA